jgi:hypothetical protein
MLGILWCKPQQGMASLGLEGLGRARSRLGKALAADGSTGVFGLLCCSL